MKLLFITLLLIAAPSWAGYTYEATDVRPWAAPNTTTSTTEAQVAAYVPGSNIQAVTTINFVAVERSKANSLGDKVGSKNTGNISGWVKPAGGAKVTVNFPMQDIYGLRHVSTAFTGINDDRFAVGWSSTVGGHMYPFIYDLESGEFSAPNLSASTSFQSINNNGQIAGFQRVGGINAPVTYTCDLGLEVLPISANGILIEDDGTIHGRLTPEVEGFRFYSATPDTPYTPSCELMDRSAPPPVVDPEPELCGPGEVVVMEDDGPKCENAEDEE